MERNDLCVREGTPSRRFLFNSRLWCRVVPQLLWAFCATLTLHACHFKPHGHARSKSSGNRIVPHSLSWLPVVQPMGGRIRLRRDREPHSHSPNCPFRVVENARFVLQPVRSALPSAAALRRPSARRSSSRLLVRRMDGCAARDSVRPWPSPGECCLLQGGLTARKRAERKVKLSTVQYTIHRTEVSVSTSTELACTELYGCGVR